MSEIDAKVNMSLDEIIKMEKKRKVTNGTGRGLGRGAGMRGRGRGATRNGESSFATRGSWKRFPNFKTRGGFVQKKFKNTGLTRSKSNTALNFTGTTRGSPRGGLRGGRGGSRGSSRGATRGVTRGITRGGSTRGGRGFGARRGLQKFGMVRSKSRSNLNFTQTNFFANKSRLNRSSSLPNLQDPTNVHSRLGYQSPAQVAYRNRVKRAKQLLLQRQRVDRRPSNYPLITALKTLPSLQQRALERKQQLITASRHFAPGSLRSEQILRAQRRAQYEQKILRLNTARSNPNTDVNFMCTLGAPQYPANARSQAAALSAAQNTFLANNARHLQRGRSPFRRNRQAMTTLTPQAGRTQLFPQRQRRSRSRSRSRSRPRGNMARPSMNEMDDRSFSEVMYSLSGNLGVTGRTLNDRFSF